MKLLPARRFCATAISLSFSFIGFTQADEVTSLRDSKDVISLTPLEENQSAGLKVPDRPKGHVSDTTHFLSEEAFRTLEATLEEVAKTRNVHVYALIVSSIPKGSTTAFTKQVADDWMRNQFGAIVIFNDETGQVSIRQSEEVAARFYDFELSSLLQESMSTKKRPRASREGFVYTVLRVKDSICLLKDRAELQERKSGRMKFYLGGACLVGLLAAGFGLIRKTQGSPMHPDADHL